MKTMVRAMMSLALALAVGTGIGCASSEEGDTDSGQLDLPPGDSLGDRRTDGQDIPTPPDAPDRPVDAPDAGDRPIDIRTDGEGGPPANVWVATDLRANGTALTFNVRGTPPAAELSTALTGLPVAGFTTSMRVDTRPDTATMTANDVEVTATVVSTATRRTVTARMQGISVAAVAGTVTITQGTQIGVTDSLNPGEEMRVSTPTPIVVVARDVVTLDLAALQTAMSSYAPWADPPPPPVLHAGVTYEFTITTRNIALEVNAGSPTVSTFRGTFTTAAAP